MNFYLNNAVWCSGSAHQSLKLKVSGRHGGPQPKVGVSWMETKYKSLKNLKGGL